MPERVYVAFYSLFTIGILLPGWALPSMAAELQRFAHVHLVPHPGNDGDSFLVALQDQRIRVRLYFVDCPETSVATKSDVRRVVEQTRYFGLPHGGRTVHFGAEAKAFVARHLATPFELPKEEV